MSLLRILCGQCKAHTLCQHQVVRGKGGCRSGSECTSHSRHDGLSHAPVWAELGAHRVIRHTCDEDERARWATRVQQRERPVEIASGPAAAVLCLWRNWLSASFGGGILSFLPWLARLVVLPNGHVAADGSPGRTDDGRVVRDFKLEPTVREV